MPLFLSFSAFVLTALAGNCVSSQSCTHINQQSKLNQNSIKPNSNHQPQNINSKPTSKQPIKKLLKIPY